MKDEDITPRVLLDHIQAMGVSLRLEMKAMGNQLRKDFRKEMRTEIGSLEKRMNRRFDFVDASLDNIDERLDAIEKQHLPKRVRKLELAVFQ